MAKIIETNIDKLIPDNKNFNKGTQYGQHLIENSLRKFGAGRSILLDKNNKIISGNKTTENAYIVGIDDVIIVESDGTKLIAVKRTDIDLDSETGRELALADNATGRANLEWDEAVIMEVCNDFDIDIDKWGLGNDLENDLENKEKETDSEDRVRLTFTLTNEQAYVINEALLKIRKNDLYKNTYFDNEDPNGNALFVLAKMMLE